LKKFIIILIIIASVSGAFYYLRYYFEKEEVESWDLVPKNALAVYEMEDPPKIWNEFRDLSIWENLSTIPGVWKFDEELSTIDTLHTDRSNLENLLGDVDFLISFHKVSNTDLDIIFYLPIQAMEKRKKLNDILLYFNQIEGTEWSTRNYQNIMIHEINQPDSGSQFSYIEYKNYFIGSFTPFLIDDVVRNISGHFQINFKSEVSEIFLNKPIETDEGNLYVNLTRIPDMIRMMADPSQDKEYGNFFRWLAEASYYDVSFEGNQLFFNGASSVPRDRYDYFLSTFYDQDPQTIGSISYLPNLTATYLCYTYSDFVSWRMSVDRYWQSNFPVELENKTSFLQNYDIYEKDFYGWIGNEIGLATLQSIDIDNPDRLIFISTSEVESGIKTLDDLTLFVNQANDDTLLYEVYGDKNIRKLGIEEFPSNLLGGAFTGFESSYYTSLDDYIVIGNSFDVIKKMLNDLEDENTWGKSLNFVRFYENIQKKANLSYFINFSNAWNSFYGSLNEKWKDFFKKYDYQFKHFEQISFQFSNINNHFYTSAAIQHRPSTAVIETPTSFLKEQLVVTRYPVITKPFVVKNHLDRSLEVVLQDSASNFYLISSRGDIIWSKPIGEKIKGEVFQVDFYMNNKLQYLFATENGLHIIDRNGEYISGFPLKFKESIDIEWINLIDYDNSKRYRILLGDQNGKIFLFDKYGELLEGWNPKELGGRFSSAPFHLRVGGRDCMIAIEENGTVNSLTRRGEFYNGFPVKFENRIESPVFVQRGTDFSRTLIHLILANGEINKCNMNGTVVEKIQLYRPGKESYFEIIQDVLSNTYVVCRQDFNFISLQRPDGEVIFEKELLFSGKLEVQFYNFSAGNEVYAFTDPQQAFTYLFDGNGNLINQQPIESGFEIGLIYSEVNNIFHLYSCYGNQFSISSFYRK
jgi:hypothetical protein